MNSRICRLERRRRMKKATLAAALAAGLAVGLGVSAAAESIVTVKAIPYYAEGTPLDDEMKEKCLLDVRYDKDAKPGQPVVIWLHGGGLEIGKRWFLPLSDRSIVQVAADYRLMRETKNVRPEDCIRDTAAVVAWTFRHIAEYGGDPKKVYLSGLSAGGYLTFMVGCDPRPLKEFGFTNTDLAGLVPISGQVTKHFRVRYYQEDGKSEVGWTDHDRLMVHGKYFIPKIDEFAPLSMVANKMPPIVAICGTPTRDMAGRPEENRFFVGTLRALGKKDCWYVEVPYADHGGAFRLGYPYIEELIRGKMPVGARD